MSKLVCLDAGHGGKDSGACGNGLMEKDIALKVIKKIGSLLMSNGISVVYTRTDDTFKGLSERCRIANSRACDCFVSVHTNSAVNAQANGIETLCYTKNSLAFYIQQNLIGELKLTDRGVKERKDLYVLNSTDMEAVLVELGFISNIANAGLMKKESFLTDSAECIARGICKYLGTEFKGEEINMAVEELERIYKYKNSVKAYKVLNYNGKNYVAIRDLAELTDKRVEYDNKTKITELRDKA